MQDTIPESTVVAAACAGDTAAFESLFRKHYQSVYGLAYRLTGNVSEAEDVAQMVFLRAVEAIHGFRSGARFETWLYRITVNLVKDQNARSRTRRLSVEGYAADKTAKSADREPADCGMSDPQSVIRAALLHLPKKERAAIVLTVCLEMTHARAAEVLACPEGTVSWRVHRAKRMIHSFLTHEGENG